MKNEYRTLSQRLKRVLNAGLFSKRGFVAAWRHEAAFRDELLLCLVGLPVIVLSSTSKYEKLALGLTLLAVLIVELLNSAIEAIVDLVSPDHHELAGRAKDLGSAAVGLALCAAALTWAFVLL